MATSQATTNQDHTDLIEDGLCPTGGEQPKDTSMTRRKAFAVATAASIAPVAPFAWARSHEDAQLLELGAKWEGSRAACDEAAHLAEQAGELTRDIAFPSALILRPDDERCLQALASERPVDGRVAYFLPDVIEKLRKYRPGRKERRAVVPGDGLPPEALVIESFIPDPVRQARVDEIVETYDKWIAASAQARDESGVDAAEKRASDLYDENARIRAAICRVRAKTMDGLVLKARVASWLAGGAAEAREQADFYVEDGPYVDALMNCLAADFIEMLEQNAPGRTSQAA